MKILVDADACPVKDIIEAVGMQFNLAVIMVIDTSHLLRSDYCQVIQVSQGPDAVDIALINHAKKGDIVVTGDYGVASLALGKGAYAISFNGMYFTSQNIDQLMFERHLSRKQRNLRKYSSRIKKRSKEMDIHFETALIQLCENIL